MAKWDHDDLRNRADEIGAAADYAPVTVRTATAPPRKRLIEADSAIRKTYPMASGLLDYFPDALAEVARISYLGNQKHNSGQPMHHAQEKASMTRLIAGCCRFLTFTQSGERPVR
jgi:hypothetical protein